MFQMFSRKSDIILKYLCSFLFEKMPASNQEPGIFCGYCSRVRGGRSAYSWASKQGQSFFTQGRSRWPRIFAPG